MSQNAPIAMHLVDEETTRDQTKLFAAIAELPPGPDRFDLVQLALKALDSAYRQGIARG